MTITLIVLYVCVATVGVACGVTSYVDGKPDKIWGARFVFKSLVWPLYAAYYLPRFLFIMTRDAIRGK